MLVYILDKTPSVADVTVEIPRKTLEQRALDPSVSLTGVKSAGDTEGHDRFFSIPPETICPSATK